MFISEFIKYLKFEKRYSEHTIRAYTDDINQFIAFQQNIDPLFADPKNIGHQNIRNWIFELSQTGHSPRTISRKLSSVKKYFRYLVSENCMDTNPFAKILSPKVLKELPQFINAF